jgi:hypothetical protein
MNDKDIPVAREPDPAEQDLSSIINVNLSMIYDSLWSKAVLCFEGEGVQADHFLYKRHDDHRRGLTLMASPSQNVCDSVSSFLSRIAPLTSGQYLYSSESFHLTVFSLFTAAEKFQPYYEKLPAYLCAVER